MVFLEEEPNDFHRIDYYLAQIAAEIARMNSRDPQSISVDSKLLHFTSKKSEKKKALTVEEKTKRSKAAWFGAVKASKRKRRQ